MRNLLWAVKRPSIPDTIPDPESTLDTADSTLDHLGNEDISRFLDWKTGLLLTFLCAIGYHLWSFRSLYGRFLRETWTMLFMMPGRRGIELSLNVHNIQLRPDTLEQYIATSSVSTWITDPPEVAVTESVEMGEVRAVPGSDANSDCTSISSYNSC